MTRILLDTHALVWAVTAPDRLGTDAGSLIRDATNEMLVSAASAWELSTKVRLKKFPEAVPIVENYRSIITRLGATDLPISAEHALAAGSLGWDHRDPFDRILAAQAIGEAAILVTKDAAFDDVTGLTTRWG